MEQQSLQHPIHSRKPTVATLEAPAQTIHDEINRATRRQHTTLNRLIIDRIPLGLPPFATGLSSYGQGVTAFAQIYFAFEQTWDELVEANSLRDINDGSHEAGLLSWLATLRPAGLVRSRCLGMDLQHISRRSNTDLHLNSPAYQHIIQRTRQLLRRRPHTLVAYAWVMYMALFSGGRWIRQILSRAGPMFWDDAMSKSNYDQRHNASPGTPGFSFLFFDDGKDGTAIQAEFKSRLADAETLLSEKERREIVGAAVALFDDCITLVGVLDDQTRGNRRQWSWQLVVFITGLAGLALGVSGVIIFFGWASIGSDFPSLSWRWPVMDGVVRSVWARMSQCRN